MTTERLAEIAARYEAARPKEDRGGEELKMSVLPMKTAGTRIHYADNDLAAIVYGNIGLDAEEYALAKFFAYALVDMRDMLEEIKHIKAKLEWHEYHDEMNETIRSSGEVV